jgi:hypothetical protein
MFKLDENSAFGPHNTRSAMQMTAKPKFRLDLIEQAHRALEALPEHRPEELTKAQAIQMLIAPIRATQAKGYSLAAIGKVLSDSGIPITTGGLRLYVGGAKGGVGGKKKHNAKRTEKRSTNTASAAATSNPPTAPSRPAGPAVGPAVAPTARKDELDWGPAARSDNATPSQAGARRAGFHVRPDTRDI